jgi:hypothetical protein
MTGVPLNARLGWRRSDWPGNTSCNSWALFSRPSPGSVTALLLPERWRAPMGVTAGESRQDHLLGLAVLGFSRDSLIAATIFQSGI